MSEVTLNPLECALNEAQALRRQVDALQAANAKLREELDAAKHDLSLFSEKIVATSAENVRLRELAAILCHCMQIKASCDDCRINGHKGELASDPLCACDSLHEMLRELGIEVGL